MASGAFRRSRHPHLQPADPAALEKGNTRPAEAEAFPKEEDLVIIGDANVLQANEPAVSAFEKAGLRDLSKADMKTYLPGDGAPFDRVFVPKAQPEFKGSQQEVTPEYLAARGLTVPQFVARYSDHLMIVTQVQVLEDDD